MNSDSDTSYHPTVFDIVHWIRLRPNIFLDGDRSITRIRSFLIGYQCGRGECFGEAGGEQFGNYIDWLASRLNLEVETASWWKMLLRIEGNEHDAYDRFYSLFDEYCSENGIMLKPIRKLDV